MTVDDSGSGAWAGEGGEVEEAKRLLEQFIQTHAGPPGEERELQLEAADVQDFVSVARVALAALKISSDEKCTRDRKAPVDIDIRPAEPSGDLIKRCQHDPAHCWTLMGAAIECPE